MGIAYICLNEDFTSAGKPQVHPVVKTPPEMIAITGPDTINNSRNEGQYAPAFTPMLTPYRSVIWSITEGSQWAKVNANGKVTPVYDSANPDLLHDVTIKCTSFSHPSIFAIKSIKCKASLSFTAASPVVIKCDEERPQTGKSYIIRGIIDGDECPFVAYNPLAAEYAGKLTLTDNGDGTALLTVLSDEYIHQVPITGYNTVYPAKNCTIKININDFIIINAADGQNSADLLEVFYSNGMCAEPDKMWQSEAWVVTSL